ncbi:MAG TPA: hypothetical protein VK846_17980 [Candidatus Limnocylindria bacterium]|nr:hypothetical protein [Candidatus Limnocylindria bacterium]
MSAPVLVCFAVPQEAKPFRQLVRGRTDVRVLITGMGAHNAEQPMREALKSIRPARVFSCGFAGGLDPALKCGAVVFDPHTTPHHLAAKLQGAGAAPASFVCSERVVITVAEKSALRASTGADAVEMESAIIHQICRKAEVECATVRVISDSAGENLPLDFNALTTTEQKLSSTRLAIAILKAPHKIPALMRLGRNSTTGAQRLAEVLMKII